VARRSDGHLSLSERGDSLQIFGQPVRGFPCVMTRLHIQPQVRSVAAQLAESHCHVGGHRRVTFHHAIQRLAADPQQHRDLTDRAPLPPKLWQNITLEEDARMHGGPGDLVPLNNKFLGQSYYLKILVILFQINSESSRRIPFERDAPRSVHVDAMANWFSFQRMQTETGKIQVLQIVRRCQGVQHVSASLSQSGIDLRAMSGFVQLPESLMPETLDHVLKCNAMRVTCQVGRYTDLAYAAAFKFTTVAFRKRRVGKVVRPEGFEAPTLRSEVTIVTLLPTTTDHYSTIVISNLSI
jgi:hypothetical protein